MVHVKQVELLAMLVTALTYCIRHPGKNDDILLSTPADFAALKEAEPKLLEHTQALAGELRGRIEKHTSSNILVATQPKEVEAFYAAAAKCHQATLVPLFAKHIPNLIRAPYCLPTNTLSNRPPPIENTLNALKVAKAQPLLGKDGKYHYKLPRVLKPEDQNLPSWITQGGGLTQRSNSSLDPTAPFNSPSRSPMRGSPSRGAAKKPPARPRTSATGAPEESGDALSKLTKHLYTERRLPFPEVVPNARGCTCSVGAWSQRCACLHRVSCVREMVRGGPV